MWSIILNLLLTALALYLSAKVSPGVSIEGFGNAVWIAVVLALVNFFIKPILMFFSFPLTVLSLGLFIFVINSAIILLVSCFVSSFHVEGFWSALLFSIIFSVVSWIIQMIVGVKA